jgi:cytoskeletal protein RodZ
VAKRINACKPLRPQPDVAAIRRSRGITLDQISESTKISKRFLLAIEAGDFDQLPGGIFNTSYLKQYARAIDFDEDDLLEYYYSKTGAGTSDDGGNSESRKKNTSKGFSLRMVLERF